MPYLEKSPLNKTPALTKRMNMDIWVAGTLNRLFIRAWNHNRNRNNVLKNPFMKVY